MKTKTPQSHVEMNICHSEEHRRYIASLKREKRKVRVWQISILVAILLFWEIGTRLGLMDAFILSSPTRIIKTTVELARGNLALHIATTLAETVVGFLLSTAIGLFFAIALWHSETARKIFMPYLVVLNSLPKIALGPIIIIWVGSGMPAIVAMTILICVVITTLNILHGFCEIDSDMIFLLKSMGASKSTTFKKLVFPQTLPLIISTLKINVGLAFVGAIMGEYLVSRAGLGYLIVYGSAVFDLDLVMSGAIILLFLAGGVYYAVALFEKKFSSIKK